MTVVTELSPDGCEQLLRTAHVGRVALVAPDGPLILPVNYAVRDHAVVVRTDPGGPLVKYGVGAAVAFEVDVTDDEYWSGWSILARGRGELSEAPPEPRSGLPVPRPWADGDRSCEFRLSWSSLTGRMLGLVGDPTPGRVRP